MGGRETVGLSGRMSRVHSLANRTPLVAIQPGAKHRNAFAMALPHHPKGPHFAQLVNTSAIQPIVTAECNVKVPAMARSSMGREPVGLSGRMSWAHSLANRTPS